MKKVSILRKAQQMKLQAKNISQKRKMTIKNVISITKTNSLALVEANHSNRLPVFLSTVPDPPIAKIRVIQADTLIGDMQL